MLLTFYSFERCLSSYKLLIQQFGICPTMGSRRKPIQGFLCSLRGFEYFKYVSSKKNLILSKSLIIQWKFRRNYLEQPHCVVFPMFNIVFLWSIYYLKFSHQHHLILGINCMLEGLIKDWKAYSCNVIILVCGVLSLISTRTCVSYFNFLRFVIGPKGVM